METNYNRLVIILLCLSYPILLFCPRNFSNNYKAWGQSIGTNSLGTPDRRPEKLVTFFESRNCPAVNYVNDFITYADDHKIDWRLLPVIAVLESSGGKNYPPETQNIFGWSWPLACFPDIPSSIDHIAGRLANSPYYKDKSLDEKIKTYNKLPWYHEKARKLMEEIEDY